MNRKPEIYENWKKDGSLDKKIEFIRDCTKKLVTQKEICRCLGLTERTMIIMRKKHPDIQDAMDRAKIDLKKELMGAIYKRAVGFEIIDEDQVIEDAGKGKEPKRKINRTKKTVAPDTRSAIYLLTKHFGREFSEKKDELDLMEERNKITKEEWNNELSNDENK